MEEEKRSEISKKESWQGEWWVHHHRDEVAKSIYRATQEVEAWAEVGNGGRREGQYRFGFSNEGYGLGFGERKVANEKGRDVELELGLKETLMGLNEDWQQIAIRLKGG